jgi:hypothetical protein
MTPVTRLAAGRRAKRALPTFAVCALLAGCGGGDSRHRAPRPATPVGASHPDSGFGWLRAQPPPRGWRSATLRAATATLSYPPSWSPVAGDAGTATAALRAADGTYVGYLNATPRQAREALSTWSTFRLAHNRAEGDLDVREIAAAQGLSFGGARGSCVIDQYVTRPGSHSYREIACLVAGRHTAAVFVGAAPPPRWASVAPLLQLAADSFSVR